MIRFISLYQFFYIINLNLKNVVKKNDTAMNEEYENFNQLFYSSQNYSYSEHQSPIFSEHFDDLFEDPSNQNIFDVVTPFQRKITDQHQLFQNSNQQNDQIKSFDFVSNKENIASKKLLKKKKIKKEKKQLAKSQITKNVCYNIIQKTIKVIKLKEYSFKLKELCQEHNSVEDEFIEYMVNLKGTFTGPKSLEYFLEQKTSYSIIFGQFLKWFLKQKYIRHAMQEGEMKNIHIYIQFKNDFILPMLEL